MHKISPIFLIILSILAISSCADKPTFTTMYDLCKLHVTANLNTCCPATIKFPKFSEIHVQPDQGGGKDFYTFRGWVDAENIFGALQRTYYTCDMTYVGKGAWRGYGLMGGVNFEKR